MKTTLGCVCLLLALAGCEESTNETICFWLPHMGGTGGGGAETTGGGGEGGTTIATTSTSSGGQGGACEPLQSFTGSSACFDPTAECCDLQGADLAKHCFVTTNGARPVPTSCAIVPALPSSPETDERECSLVAIADLGCQWGPSFLLCCEP